MRLRLFFLLLFVFVFSSLNAQTSPDSTTVFKKHALQFRLYNILSLSSFKGKMLSYKYHFNDQNALRIGISASVQGWTEDETNSSSSPDTAFQNEEQSTNGYNGTEVIIEYLKYFNVQKELKMFLGTGPRAFINYRVKDTQKPKNNEYHSYDTYYLQSEFQIGLSASYGVEWFFRKNMSLHAEYGLNISYFFTDYRRTRIYARPEGNTENKSSETRKGIKLDSRGATLGLSIYF